MKLLDDYFRIQAEIYSHFGYVEDWVVIPLDDARKYFWHFDGESVAYSPLPLTDEVVENGEHYYINELYTQRFLPKWEYRAADYTMLCVDTHTDGNKFLQVFDNAKEMERNPETNAWTLKARHPAGAP